MGFHFYCIFLHGAAETLCHVTPPAQFDWLESNIAGGDGGLVKRKRGVSARGRRRSEKPKQIDGASKKKKKKDFERKKNRF